MGIQNRLTLVMALLMGGIGVLGAAAVVWQERSVRDLLESQTLESVRSMQRVAEELQRSELELKTDILASNPGFVGYVSQALAAGNEPGGVVDAASIRDLLDERRRQYDFDFAGIMDPRGNSVVLLGNVLQSVQDISKTSLLARVRANSVASSELWSNEGHLVLVTLSPMLRGDTLEALLLTGIDINQGFVDPLAGSSRAEVALIGFSTTGQVVVASTLNALAQPALIAALEDKLASSQGDGAELAPVEFEFDAGDGMTRATATPLFDSPSAGLLVTMTPNRQRALSALAIHKPAYIAGAVALLLFLVLWLILHLRLVRPLVHVVDMSNRILRGDIQVVFRDFGNTAICRVGHAFNHVLGSLRGYKHAMESQGRDAK